MLLLNEQEQDVFNKLARSNDADILRSYITKLINEVTNIDNLNSDIIINMRNVKSILKTGLLDYLTDSTVEAPEEDSYE